MIHQILSQIKTNRKVQRELEINLKINQNIKASIHLPKDNQHFLNNLLVIHQFQVIIQVKLKQMIETGNVSKVCKA